MGKQTGTFERPTETVSIQSEDGALRAELLLPEMAASGVVVFAHGTGSDRHSTRNRTVADALAATGLVALLPDLHTEAEQRDEPGPFDGPRLGRRLLDACEWLDRDPRTQGLGVGLFGASTGAAAALHAAAEQPERIHAVVSRGGRTDLAERVLSGVEAPTLMIAGGEDRPVLEVNQRAMRRLGGRKRLEVVANATHLFEEMGALECVARLSRNWFLDYLPAPGETGV